MLAWPDIDAALESAAAPQVTGRVTGAAGILAEVAMPCLRVGALVEVHGGDGEVVQAEVVGVDSGGGKLMPVGEVRGFEVGSEVRALDGRVEVAVGPELLGRVVDALGRPLDDRGPVLTSRRAPLLREPLNPLSRPPIRHRLALGVRSIDAALTCGRGQRVAIMAGSGVGKSTLLGMIARRSEAEINVVALIGERGREVREFLEDCLGEEALQRSVIVVATADSPPLQRIRAAHLATAVAESFREDGRHVLLLMDSATRIAMAQREVGLAAGEPPTSKGYTPSVFSLLPRIFERAGTAAGGGSVTGLYTVLTEGDDLQDPVADAVRANLDGHVVLSRALSDRGHYPPVDVLRSSSRVMGSVVEPAHAEAARQLRATLATWEEAEDLINLGAYARGSNGAIDAAMDRIDPVRAFLQQGVEEGAGWDGTVAGLRSLFERSEDA